MIDTIIFDWGGVCAPGHLLRDFSAKLSALSGIDKTIIEKKFREIELPYETGQIKPRDFWDNFCDKLESKISSDQARKVFFDSYKVDQNVLNLIKNLKEKHTTILLTNNYEDLFTHIKDKFNLTEYFHKLISSSEVKSKKPYEEMYKYAMNKYNIKPENSIFIDDKEKNVEAAKNLGFKGITFNDIDQLKVELKAYFVKV
jgi:epoxide hydrolase-like predicted phosphatase